uniref:Putative basic tail protein n=1 Tax=Ixodes ricinus TaxID=34613 RepID=A0A0K8R7B0_IXORI
MFLIFSTGDVMCISIDPRVCTSDVYPVDGYAPSCSFTCLNEGMQEVVNYQTGTFCFAALHTVIDEAKSAD